MRSSPNILKSAIAAATKTLQSIVDLDRPLARAAEMVEQCLRGGNKLLVCGNGGSASDAAHFATELVVRFTKDRPAHPVIGRPRRLNCSATASGRSTQSGSWLPQLNQRS